MGFSEEQLESLSQKIEERERLARRRAWLLSGIPVVFALLFLAYTAWQIAQAQAKLAAANGQLAAVEQDFAALQAEVPQAQAELAAAQTEVSQANSALATATAQLATATAQIGEAMSELSRVQAFAEYGCRIDETVLKEYSSDYTVQVEMLLYLQEIQYRDVPWNPGGFSEAEGFDSPNFALFVLQRFNLISQDILPGTRPWEFLPAAAAPENGDIIYYEGGYTMFYYKLPLEFGGTDMQECVIGMTPLRVRSLKVDFAKRLGALKVPYP
ncbi:MAG: hypothetical protein DPW18_14595 [Chloroflexi bacterium]|nr:hypothetical protein [Chloroflexota bacterium]MDL1942079.1 hypothetical protein [Chloroflexi bacterium CFX2]